VLNAKLCSQLAIQTYKLQGYEDVSVIVTLDWKERPNGVKPKPSIVPNTIAKDKCPILLVNFYETRINYK
jgi:hypothetical protein